MLLRQSWSERAVSYKNRMEEDLNMTSTYLEPEEMEDFVKHHVQQQSGFNNVDRDEAFANLTQIWLELGTFHFFCF